MKRHAAATLLGIATLAAAAASWAAAAEEGPNWASLSRAQQAALAPLQRDWSTIDPPRKEKWLEIVGRFPSMPEAERQRVQARMTAWTRMTPAERGQARLQFQETRQFSPEDRQARWEAYKALPDDQRAELAQRAKPAPARPPAAEQRGDGSAKRNTVPVVRQTNAKSVAPTVVQAKPGATTSLLSTKPPPPAHQQPGLPKIAATEGFVNPNTLLPRRGPQGAAVSAAASGPANRP